MLLAALDAEEQVAALLRGAEAAAAPVAEVVSRANAEEAGAEAGRVAEAPAAAAAPDAALLPDGVQAAFPVVVGRAAGAVRAARGVAAREATAADGEGLRAARAGHQAVRVAEPAEMAPDEAVGAGASEAVLAAEGKLVLRAPVLGDRADRPLGAGRGVAEAEAPREAEAVALLRAADVAGLVALAAAVVALAGPLGEALEARDVEEAAATGLQGPVRSVLLEPAGAAAGEEVALAEALRAAGTAVDEAARAPEAAAHEAGDLDAGAAVRVARRAAAVDRLLVGAPEAAAGAADLPLGLAGFPCGTGGVGSGGPGSRRCCACRSCTCPGRWSRWWRRGPASRSSSSTPPRRRARRRRACWAAS